MELICPSVLIDGSPSSNTSHPCSLATTAVSTSPLRTSFSASARLDASLTSKPASANAASGTPTTASDTAGSSLSLFACQEKKPIMPTMDTMRIATVTQIDLVRASTWISRPAVVVMVSAWE